MGCEIVVGGATVPEAAAVKRLFIALELMLSRFRPESDLERLNRSRRGDGDRLPGPRDRAR